MVLQAKPPELPNLGGTCYLNSTLQCIYNLEGFRNAIMEQQDLTGKAPLVEPVIDILWQMQRHSSLTNEDIFQESCELIKERFGRGQQDAHDFLNNLIDQIEKSVLSQEIINDMFRIKTEKIVVNQGDNPTQKNRINKRTEDIQSWFTIGVEQYNNNTIPELITNAYRKENTPQGKDRYTRIVHLPQYLTIFIPGFIPGERGLLKRATGTIRVPDTLTFTQQEQIINPDDIPILSYDAPNRVSYRINSSSIYNGEIISGHYWAYVYQNNQWWICNDEIIEPKPFPDEWIMQAGNPFPYLIFYERVSPKEQTPTPQPEPASPGPTVSADDIATYLTSLYRNIYYLYRNL